MKENIIVMNENIIFTKFEPHECFMLVQSKKTGTIEKI